MNIVLLGPQGSGKGTQGLLIAQKFNLYYFDSGSHLREAAHTRPDLDKYVNQIGQLVPDDIMIQFVIEHFTKLNKFDGIVFDGYPRSLDQYMRITDFLRAHNTKIDIVLNLDISEAETVRRLSSRRTDPKTGKVYNLITNPPPPEVDVNSLVQREDDTPEKIATRLGFYHSTTQPLLEHLKNEGIVTHIDGMKPVNDIFSEIKNVLTKRFPSQLA